MKGQLRKQMTFGDDKYAAKSPEHPTLEGVERFIDWRPMDRILSRAYGSSMGRPSYAPRLMLKSLLLAQWFNLSDRDLEFQLKDRLSFQKFLGLGLSDELPDATTLCRFRQRLLDAGLYESLFEAINAQLDKMGLIIRRGTLIDATFVQARNVPPTASQDPKDEDADWAVRGRHARYGYKCHVSADLDHGIVRGCTVTPGNANDGSQFDRLMFWDSQSVFADKAYCSYKRKRLLRELGIFCGILDKGQSHLPLNKNQRSRNVKLSKIRSAIERCFAHLKVRYGFYRGRYGGLAKMTAHTWMLLMAYNLRKTVKILAEA